MFDKLTYDGHVIEVVSQNGPYLIDGENVTKHVMRDLSGRVGSKKVIRTTLKSYVDEYYESPTGEDQELSDYLGLEAL